MSWKCPICGIEYTGLFDTDESKDPVCPVCRGYRKIAKESELAKKYGDIDE